MGLRFRALQEASELVALSRLNVSEKAALAGTTDEHEVLTRLAKDKSPTVATALIDRHVARGDLSAVTVLQIVEANWGNQWVIEHAVRANELRTLPGAPVIARLAKKYPRVATRVDDATADELLRINDLALRVPLAWRRSDERFLAGLLDDGMSKKGGKVLRALLIQRRMPLALTASAQFRDDLLDAAARLDGTNDATVLLVAAGQIPSAVATGRLAALDPADLASCALGPYRSSSFEPRHGVLSGAQVLWSSSDLTVEHSLARARVADAGRPFSVVETSRDTYVATPEAIYAFPKTDQPSYTYAHLYLERATAFHANIPDRLGNMTHTTFGGFGSRMPALDYRKEITARPDVPSDPPTEAIIWPIPLTPAIYSLSTSLVPETFFAVADGMTADVQL